MWEAWRKRYPKPPTPKQAKVLRDLANLYDAPGLARTLRDAPTGRDALAHVLATHERSEADAKADVEAMRRVRPVDTSAEAEAYERAEELRSRVIVSPPPPPPPPTVEPEPDPVVDEAEAYERGRRAAIAALRAGLPPAIGERYRERYAITAEELAASE